ncbi:hypothetical protein BC834DRAFT_90033 [Gloeopeniophorella convolvens]|nr:hypothetical protein BC834DRAFT_90033 [Gloeopeniophorella convolvens]
MVTARTWTRTPSRERRACAPAGLRACLGNTVVGGCAPAPTRIRRCSLGVALNRVRWKRWGKEADKEGGRVRCAETRTRGRRPRGRCLASALPPLGAAAHQAPGHRRAPCSSCGPVTVPAPAPASCTHAIPLQALPHSLFARSLQKTRLVPATQQPIRSPIVARPRHNTASPSRPPGSNRSATVHCHPSRHPLFYWIPLCFFSCPRSRPRRRRPRPLYPLVRTLKPHDAAPCLVHERGWPVPERQLAELCPPPPIPVCASSVQRPVSFFAFYGTFHSSHLPRFLLASPSLHE